ncbi:metaxin-1 isoform X1 [Trichogramma pretiosum]|uniref:metaxin-1 isoform X1 n=1 Tax=Trichogramma pretiosum TaxID=7493 RepID=UPI0006C95C59|nr:metaxin-1 isoform X1 [Trichogramma pretiosum]XP_014223862.1 metaxin-1 isoform X1 [Trichogramma pretiosum]
MSSNESFQLEIWKGDWGLPSVEVDCLKILAYAKFSNLSLHVKTTNNPFKSPTGQLPVLRYQNEVYTSVDQIFDLFQQHKFTPDNDITRLQSAEIDAFKTMLDECVRPAIQYLWWVDVQNLNQVIRPWYCKVLSFPFNFYYPGKYEKQAKFMVEALHPTKEEKDAEVSIYSKAQKCITLLSTRLGESNYFFGSNPTTFDVLVFSHLAPILKVPLPNCSLQNHLKACSNLVKFTNGILQKYFEDDYQEYEKSKSEKEMKTKVQKDDFPNKRRNQILAGIFAGTAMLGYAWSMGIVQVITYLIRSRKFLRLSKGGSKRSGR